MDGPGVGVGETSKKTSKKCPNTVQGYLFFSRKYLIINNLPRMDSNHDKVIQSHLCYRYTTRQKGGKFAYHIVGKSQAKGMTDDKSQMTNWEVRGTAPRGGFDARVQLEDAGPRLGARIGPLGSSTTEGLMPLRNLLGRSGARLRQAYGAAGPRPTRFVICYLSFVIAA